MDSAADRLAKLSYVVVDVETTGTSPDRGDRVTEILAARRGRSRGEGDRDLPFAGES